MPDATPRPRPCCIPTCRRFANERLEHPLCFHHAKAVFDAIGRAYSDAAEAGELGALLDAPTFGRRGRVYFAKVGPDRIKIGYSTDIPRRMRQIKGELIASKPGSLAEERALHAHFRDAAVGHELFRPTPELLQYIARLGEAA